MKMRIARRAALAAGLAAIAEGACATRMSLDPVTFEGVFAAPLVQGVDLRGPKGARVSAGLRLTNTTPQTLRVSTLGAVTLELLDGQGRTVPFAGGANMGMAIRPGEGVAISAGQSLTLPLAGTLRLAGRELSWRGDDGVMGTWPVNPTADGYSLRLRYRPLNAAAWKGQGVSSPSPLPLKG